jgi:hypothetical protein
LTLITGILWALLYFAGVFEAVVMDEWPFVFCLAVPGTFATLLFSFDAIVKIVRRKLGWKEKVYTVTGVAMAVVPPATAVFVALLFRF